MQREIYDHAINAIKEVAGEYITLLLKNNYPVSASEINCSAAEHILMPLSTYRHPDEMVKFLTIYKYEIYSRFSKMPYKLPAATSTINKISKICKMACDDINAAKIDDAMGGAERSPASDSNSSLTNNGPTNNSFTNNSLAIANARIECLKAENERLYKLIETLNA